MPTTKTQVAALSAYAPAKWHPQAFLRAVQEAVSSIPSDAVSQIVELDEVTSPAGETISYLSINYEVLEDDDAGTE